MEKHPEKSRRHHKLRFLSGRPTNENVPDVSLASLVPLPPPPATSSFPADEESNVTPGAYAATPDRHSSPSSSSPPEPRAPARITSTMGGGDTPPASSVETTNVPSTNHASSNDGPYMAVANLVVDPELPTAQVVDPNEGHRNKRYLMGGFGLLFLLLLGTGIALGMVLSDANSKAVSDAYDETGTVPDGTSSPILSEALPGETSVPTMDTTGPTMTVAPSGGPAALSPTEGPDGVTSSQPTFVDVVVRLTPPTPAPTANNDEYILSLLPEYTLQAIRQGRNLPQSLALDFVRGDVENGLPDWRIKQRFALTTLYHTTTGGWSWRNQTGWSPLWNTELHADECQWFSRPSLFDEETEGDWNLERGEIFVYDTTNPNPCDREDPTNVTQGSTYRNLWLWDNLLRGPLPREFYWLTSLRSLNLDGPSHGFVSGNYVPPNVASRTALNGTLASELGLLRELEVLSMANNMITGTLPTELLELSSLKYLGLSWNLLGGSLLTEIGDMPNLEFLDLWANSFTGLIPSELGKLSRLKRLDLNKNIFEAPAPFVQITNISNLKHLSIELSVQNSTFLSELPDLWRIPSLRYLSLYGFLQGTLPTWINSLSKLTFLSIMSSPLGGDIPTNLRAMTSLSTLRIAKTNVRGFHGSIPTVIFNLTELSHLDLSYNRFLGTVPTEIGTLSHLEYLDLSANLGCCVADGIDGQITGLAGPLPSELGMLTLLEHLFLHQNDFSGTIPSQLGSLSVAHRLDLSQNTFSGPIPSEFGTLSTLQILDLYQNYLSGEIPTELAALTSIWRLMVADNMLSGVVPDDMCNDVELIFGCPAEAGGICGCEDNESIRCPCPITAPPTGEPTYSGPTAIAFGNMDSSGTTVSPMVSEIDVGSLSPSESPTFVPPSGAPGITENPTIVTFDIGSGSIPRTQRQGAVLGDQTVKHYRDGKAFESRQEYGGAKTGVVPGNGNVFYHPETR